MTGLHESTLAMSVYFALTRVGALTRGQILDHLLLNWRSDVNAEEVDRAVAFLAANGFVGADEPIAPLHWFKGHPRKIRRGADVTKLELL